MCSTSPQEGGDYPLSPLWPRVLSKVRRRNGWKYYAFIYSTELSRRRRSCFSYSVSSKDPYLTLSIVSEATQRPFFDDSITVGGPR